MNNTLSTASTTCPNTSAPATERLLRSESPGCAARVDLRSWEVPALFRVLQEGGDVELQEMLRVFNMGVGMVLVVAPEVLDDVRDSLQARGESPWVLGNIVSSEEGGVVYVGEGSGE